MTPNAVATGDYDEIADPWAEEYFNYDFNNDRPPLRSTEEAAAWLTALDEAYERHLEELATQGIVFDDQSDKGAADKTFDHVMFMHHFDPNQATPSD